ncbi:MAG TPA: hypothetical protein PLJ60_17200 [Chryseolinea sp.]|nr:hypothetical protein [Chryseolinea sp.]
MVHLAEYLRSPVAGQRILVNGLLNLAFDPSIPMKYSDSPGVNQYIAILPSDYGVDSPWGSEE